VTFSAEQFTAIFPGASQEWIPAFQNASAEYGINTPKRTAAFFAQIAHESVGLTKLEESFHYKTAERLLDVFGKRRFRDLAHAQEYLKLGPEAIANRVYGLRMGNGSEASGDGYRYRARGPIGLTGANNYKRYGSKLGLPLWSKPDLVLVPKNGARSSGLFWMDGGCNELADADDFDGISDVINLGTKSPQIGDSNGYADRAAKWERCKFVMGVAA
jgi:putative chitinase